MLKNIYSGLAAKEPSAKAAFFWNLMGSSVNAAASMVLLMVVNRVNGQEIGGVFAIGFAIAQLMWSIGSFETMTYQVTDTKNKFKFSEYFGFKILACLIMIVACIVDVIIRGFDSYKMLITILLCAFRVIDAFSTLYFGTLQKEDRLNLAGFSYFARLTLSYAGMVAVLFISRNLVLSILVSCIISFLWLLLFEIPLTSNFEKMRPSFKFSKIKSIFIDCFPLFASVFLLMYLNNSPKYAVDNILGDLSVNIFSIVFMPAFVINLLSSFVFRPMLKKLSKSWNHDKDVKQFNKMANMILAVVVVATLLTLLVGYFLGIPVLSLFYGIDLSEYRFVLILVLLSGGFAAIGSALYNVITVMRKQKFLLIGYAISAIVSYLISEPLVLKLNLVGAGLVFLISMALASLIFYITFIVSVKKKIKAIRSFSNE